MSGRIPRPVQKIKYPEHTVTIAGTLDKDYGYVEIVLDKYAEAVTVQAECNDTMQIFVSSRRESLRSNCFVMLNNVRVLDGAGAYTLTITGDTTITFKRTKSGSYYYWTCEIVSRG